jgi:transcriptional regulator with XRE-family HTH domain
MLRDGRRRLGLTQRDLAARLATSQAYVSRLEDGKVSPTLDVIDAVANALDYEVLLVPRRDAHRFRSLFETASASSELLIDDAW